MTQPSEARTLSGAVRWLEDEQRQVKAHSAKLQQLIDQLQAQVWDQAERLRLAEEALTAAQAQISRLSRLEDETRQVRDLLGRLQSNFGEAAEKQGETMRLWQAEIEHERQDRGELQKKLGTTADAMEKVGARAQSVEEALRRQQESLLALRQSTADLTQRAEGLESRAAQSLEQHKRWQNDISRMDRELESFHEQVNLILERLRLLAEQLKRLEEQMGAVLAEEAARRSLEERVEVGRAERERLERKGAELEQTLSHHEERLEEHAHLLTQLDGKGKGTADRLTELREQFWDLRQQVLERLSQLTQLGEEQKRRQIAELEQQIREMKHWVANPPSD